MQLKYYNFSNCYTSHILYWEKKKHPTFSTYINHFRLIFMIITDLRLFINEMTHYIVYGEVFAATCWLNLADSCCLLFQCSW